VGWMKKISAKKKKKRREGAGLRNSFEQRSPEATRELGGTSNQGAKERRRTKIAKLNRGKTLKKKGRTGVTPPMKGLFKNQKRRGATAWGKKKKKKK